MQFLRELEEKQWADFVQYDFDLQKTIYTATEITMLFKLYFTFHLYIVIICSLQIFLTIKLWWCLLTGGRADAECAEQE